MKKLVKVFEKIAAVMEEIMGAILAVLLAGAIIVGFTFLLISLLTLLL